MARASITLVFALLLPGVWAEQKVVCYNTNSKWVGTTPTNGTATAGINTKEECAEACRNSGACDAWTWFTTGQPDPVNLDTRCFLYTGAGSFQSMASPLTGAGGPKYCDYFPNPNNSTSAAPTFTSTFTVPPPTVPPPITTAAVVATTTTFNASSSIGIGLGSLLLLCLLCLCCLALAGVAAMMMNKKKKTRRPRGRVGSVAQPSVIEVVETVPLMAAPVVEVVQMPMASYAQPMIAQPSIALAQPIQPSIALAQPIQTSVAMAPVGGMGYY